MGRYRWAVLAAGTGAQAAYLALLTAPAVLAPALRNDLGLSLTQVGVLIAAPWVFDFSNHTGPTVISIVAAPA